MKRFKKILAGALVFSMLAMNAQNIYAEPAAGQAATEEKELTAEEKATKAAHDKKFETNELEGWPQAPATYNEGSITMEINSQAILAEKDADTKYYPASITKVMTALVAVENSDMTDMVKVNEGAIACLESNASHIGLRVGEEITMEDALYALLLASANEAAYAIGETVGGTYDQFIQMMNDKAAELGCTNTHFTNSNGLHDDDHYVTARDMALIAAEAFKHPEILEIMQTPQHTIPPTNLVDEERVFQQKHKMMKQGNQYYYETCVGGKTGYTTKALGTLVTYVDNGDMQFVNVSLRSHGTYLFPDTINLMDYASENFQKVMLQDHEKPKNIKKIDPEGYVVIPKTVTFEDLETSLVAPTEKGQSEGYVIYTYKGNQVGKVRATFTKKYLESKGLLDDSQKITKEEAKKGKTSLGINVKKVVKIVLAVIAALGAIFVIVLLLALHHRKQQRRRRRRQQMLRQRRKRQQMEERERRRR